MGKKKRKIRVSKKETIQIREENKITSYQRKRKVTPGPWTDIEPKIEVKAKLRENKTGIMAEILGPSMGSYTSDTSWIEKGWYPIVFNVEAPNMKKLVEDHGMDQFLAATEKALNETVNKKGKPIYGKLIITQMCVDNSQRKGASSRFISCRGKTNYKNIKGFRAIRKGILITL